MKIAITGATGQLGRLTVSKLKEKTAKENLVALVRTPEKAADLGIEAREFDYSKPETLATSLQGIDTLFLISGSEIGQRETQHKNVINAAKEAGVKRIVYTSLLYATDSEMALAKEHVATEKLLSESGLSYTILRNGWYTENYAGSIAGALQAGAFIGSAQNGKISSATREDFAEAAAVVLTNEGHENKIYELAGDDAYTLSDLASEISKQTGKNIPYNDLTEEEYTKVLVSVGLPEGFAQILADSDAKAAKGSLYSEDKTLSKLIGRPTTPLADVVKDFIG
ncbi:NAD(P)H dehydrogenase (quinone) [Chishuiella changwenlii]|uniref:NAD(P)-dependent oxidoreductase n=1 Tax=Chishuiella changwenlii TaxID=1434701 RepID=A0A1M6TYZ6_9FLAO|nr:SDR family oxidoreductase [Chishuiella changwenlii]GGF08445.1 NAD(P)-dependent oxidoreductase [Chishuiella changwenlii]SHK62141.1 NAD(P)H dehydrogenase (quinone) [Chishuiella changwenlii]